MIPQIGARGHGLAHDVELTEMMVPFITYATAFRQNVGELVFRINVFDLDFGIQMDSVKSPIELDSVSGHVSHRRTSAFNNHLDYCFIFFKYIRKAPKRESFAFDVTSSTFLRPTSVELLDCSFRSYVGMFFTMFIEQQVAPCSGLM